MGDGGFGEGMIDGGTIFKRKKFVFQVKISYNINIRWYALYRGGFPLLTGGSFSTSWMWKMSAGKLPCPRTWNNIIIYVFLIYLGVNKAKM